MINDIYAIVESQSPITRIEFVIAEDVVPGILRRKIQFCAVVESESTTTQRRYSITNDVFLGVLQ